jgi:hypothetical protein
MFERIKRFLKKKDRPSIPVVYKDDDLIDLSDYLDDPEEDD